MWEGVGGNEDIVVASVGTTPTHVRVLGVQESGGVKSLVVDEGGVNK